MKHIYLFAYDGGAHPEDIIPDFFFTDPANDEELAGAITAYLNKVYGAYHKLIRDSISCTVEAGKIFVNFDFLDYEDDEHEDTLTIMKVPHFSIFKIDE